VLIALNAYRSAEAILAFRQRHPDRPLVVALTGTDLYRFLDSHPNRTLEAIRAADRLLVLNTLAHRALPADLHDRCFLILEAAKPLPGERRPARRHFDVSVVGHLRDEKDPLRTAEAVRGLPRSSRIRVRHYGRAHTEEWAVAAATEMASNPRYRWFGEVPHWRIRQALKTTRLMVFSSVLEGGPNALSEAMVAGVPVLATDIDGIAGVLGPDYPGYFGVGDTAALAALLTRVETDATFMESLTLAVTKRAPWFDPAREKARWATLMSELLEGDPRETAGG
jgi:putative glycosyltransferase (TIGR04348 family)